MTTIEGLNRVRVGKHTTTSEVESDGGITFVDVEHVGPLRPKWGKTKLERPLRRGDNERYTRVVGPKFSSLPLKMNLRGLNSNTGGAVTAAKQTELAPFFDSSFGVDGAGGTGTTAVTSGSSTTTLVTVDGSLLSAGGAVLFPDDTDGTIAREIVSKSSNTLTFDRAYSNTATNTGVVASAMSWYADLDAPNHKHLAADPVSSSTRIVNYGGLGGLSFDFPADGGLCTVDTSLDFTHWADADSSMSAFSAPTTGSEIPCIDARFFIGATAYMLRDAKINVEVVKSKKVTNSGLNGFAGYVVTDIKITWTGTLYFGALKGEVGESLLETFQTATAQDIAMQVGRTAGAAMYCRMPAADIEAEPVTVDGMECIAFTATASRSANHTNVPGPFRIHLF